MCIEGHVSYNVRRSNYNISWGIAIYKYSDLALKVKTLRKLKTCVKNELNKFFFTLFKGHISS